MGKQICFYMNEDDEDEFLEFIRSTGDVVILPQTTNQKKPEVILTLKELSGRRLGEGCVLWNRTISKKPIFEFFEVHGGSYCLDFLESEVVSLMRSRCDNGMLSMGRLHIETKQTLPDGSLVEKSSEFLIWFDQLCKWIRRKYPNSKNGAYISQRAEKLEDSGLELGGHRL